MNPLPLVVRLASILYLVPGLGSVISVAAILLYDARRGELPMTPFGWRLMGGPYQEVGTDSLTGLGRVLAGGPIGISMLDAIAGIWLGQGRRRGARLGVATTPVSIALGAVFVVPFLFIVPPLRALLAVAGWRNLR